MVKSEHLRRLEAFTRMSPAPLATPSSSTAQKFSTRPTINPYFIDSSPIDISSIKGRFAWEKITLSDTYMPVIFRGTTKFFCVKMVLKLIADYPDDILYRASHYRYWKKIDLFKATSSEINLLNRINSQHCHWSYSRQPFGAFTELVCVADFLPFLEHLLLHYKKQSTTSASSTDLPQAILSEAETAGQAHINTLDHQIARSSIDMVISSHLQFSTESRSQRDSVIEKLLAAELSKTLSQSTEASKPVARPSASPKRKPSQTSTMASQPVATSKFQQLPLESSSISATNPTQTASLINQSSRSWNKKPRISILTATLTGSTSSLQSLSSRLESCNVPASLSKSPDRATWLLSESFLQTSTNAPVTGATVAITPAENSITPTSTTTTTTVVPALIAINESPTSTSSTIHSGWLQINKLYTPYVSVTSENHHHYRIPINLLTFYQLLLIGTSEICTNEIKDSSFFTLSEQNLATPQEIEVINSLCLQQNIKPFTNDTALIDLATFYQYCTVNSLFIKELSMSDPKGSICKNWTLVNKTNGGLCRLRNIKTLQEQTLPVIGNSILNNLSLSLQTLATAAIIIPNDTEIEFLRLMIFYINQPVALTNPQLIDIEAVKREYTVDLILLFNDKFPINVLNYQQQESRVNSQPASIIRSNSSATNTITESTPPPSPPSPTTNSTQPTASTATESASPSRSASTSSSLTQSNPSNRFQKTITFRGHTLIAYICSDLDMTTQRECVSIRDLCHVLYPESTTMEKLEKKMFRLLRTKNINRFRPQNQELGSITRLVDIKDIETHWEFIEQELSSVSKAELVPIETKPILVPVSSDEATTSEMLEEDVNKFEPESSIPEISSEIDNHLIKRPLDDIIEDQQMENVEATVEHNGKRLRLIDLDEFGSIVSEGSDFQHLSADECDSVTEPTTNIDVTTSEQKLEQEESSITSTKKTDTSDNEHKEDVQPKRNAQPSQLKRSSIRVIRRKPNQETLLNIKQDSTIKTTNATSTNIAKKRIFFSKTRKRIGKNVLKPCTRANQKLPAAWVHKYNIEECWVHLDLYVAPDRDGRH